MEIKIGIYEVVDKIDAPPGSLGCMLRVGDALVVKRVKYNTVWVTLPELLYNYFNTYVKNGVVQWDRRNFEDMIEQEKFRLKEDNLETGQTSETNSTNEICYFCGRPTEPIIGRMRICKSCGK